MNRPNRPDRFDDLILSTLAGSVDAAGVIALRPGEAQAVLMRQGIALSHDEAEQAIARLFAAQRIAVGSEHIRIVTDDGVTSRSARAPQGTFRRFHHAALGQSLVWRNASMTARLVWLDLLTNCDADGRIDVHRAGLARRLEVSLAEVDRALAYLEGAAWITPVQNGVVALRQHDGYFALRRPGDVAVPDEWQPNEAHVEFAAECALDIEREVEAFRAFPHRPPVVALVGWDQKFVRWLAYASRRQQAAETVNDGTTEKRTRETGRGD